MFCLKASFVASYDLTIAFLALIISLTFAWTSLGSFVKFAGLTHPYRLPRCRTSPKYVVLPTSSRPCSSCFASCRARISSFFSSGRSEKNFFGPLSLPPFRQLLVLPPFLPPVLLPFPQLLELQEL